MSARLCNICRFRFTIASLVLALPLFLIFFLFQIDVFEFVFNFSRSFESWEFDEIIILFIVLFIAFSTDLMLCVLSRKKEREIEAAKLDALRMTMDKVHHIVNNSMNFLLLIHHKLEGGEELSEEDVKFLKDTIYETSKAVGDIRELKDTEISFD